MSSLKHQGPPQDGSQKKRRKGATRLSCAECRYAIIMLIRLPSHLVGVLNFAVIGLFHAGRSQFDVRLLAHSPNSSCVKRGCGQICPDVCASIEDNKHQF